MKPVWAIVTVELYTLARDRNMLFAFASIVFFSLLVLPATSLLLDWKSKQESPTQPVVEAPVCEDALWSTIGVQEADRLPKGLSWPSTFAPYESAEIHLRVERVAGDPIPTLRVIGRASDVALEPAVFCLKQLIDDARAQRFAALGLPAYPHPLARIQTLNVDEIPSFQASVLGFLGAMGSPETVVTNSVPTASGSGLGALLSGVACLFGLSLALEAVPRRRQSGLLEQLKSTQTGEVYLVGAWVLSVTLACTFVSILCAVAYVSTALVYGGLAGLEHGLHAPAIAALSAALAIRVALHADSLLSASLRSAVVSPVIMVTAGAAYMLSDTPWLAALIPLGGSLLAAAGTLGAWGFLSDVAALGWTALLVLWSARSLANEEVTNAGADPTLMRRARGNYLAEASILACFGLCCGVLSGGLLFEGHPWVGASFGFVFCMLIPTLLTPTVLGLDRRILLPLGKPNPRDLALSLPLLFGLAALAAATVPPTAAIVPDNEITRLFITQISGMVDSPLAVLALGLYPAVCEELLFRGAILGLLLRSGNTRRAIILQAAAFSISHIVPLRLPWTFSFGLIMGWIRVRTGSLWACMAVHFLLNLSFGAAQLIWATEATPFESNPGDVVYSLPLLIGLLVLPLYSTARRETEASHSTP